MHALNVSIIGAAQPDWGETIRQWIDILREFWPVVLISFAASLIATPVCRWIALKRRIVDKPDDFLKPHGKPIPYLGGIAIYMGWVAGILFVVLGLEIDVSLRLMIGFGIGGTAIMLVGLFDDLRVMTPKVKLAFNVAVGLLLVGVGLGDNLVDVVANVTQVRFGPGQRWLQLAYSVPVTLFIIVGACNATNLIDGLDGLCSGVLGIIAIGFALLACWLRILYPESPFANERIVLALAMLGAAIGFLPYNLNPAKIFMGDAGSMLLGLNAAMLILMFGEANLVRWMIGALMVFGLPIADMLLTLARRWRNGRPLMEGDRSHYYDQLRDRGLSVRRVVAISYGLTLVFVMVGVSVMFIQTRYAIMIYFIFIMATLAAVWKFNMAGIEPTRPRGSTPDANRTVAAEPHQE
jgi:UDP-GlcNAc:undecaprenyl-phosphate GlcNAc-1-phosphate transferase